MREGIRSKAALPQLPQDQIAHAKVTKKLKDFEVVAARMTQKMQKKLINQLKKYFPEFKPIDQESNGIDDEVESEEGMRIE